MIGNHKINIIRWVMTVVIFTLAVIYQFEYMRHFNGMTLLLIMLVGATYYYTEKILKWRNRTIDRSRVFAKYFEKI